MTEKEAIELLRIAIAEVEWNYPLDYAVAFEVEIKALEALEEMMSSKERLKEDTDEQ